MKEYNVCLPLTGRLWVTVEVEDDQDESDAIEKALDSEECVIDNIEEWQVCKQICQGNVFYGTMNEAFAEEA